MKKLLLLITVMIISSVGYSQVDKKVDKQFVKESNRTWKKNPAYNPNIKGIITDDLYSYDIKLNYVYKEEYNISFDESEIDNFKSMGYTRLAFHYIDRVVYYEFYK